MRVKELEKSIANKCRLMIFEIINGNNSIHPKSKKLENLLNALTDYFDEWEKEIEKPDKVQPHDVVNFLIDQAKMTRLELADKFGVEILDRKIQIDEQMAEALAKHFNVSKKTFL